MKKITLKLTAVMLISLLINTHNVVAASRITLEPGSASIDEGQSQVIGIQLDAAPGASVTFVITSSNPESVNISPSSITYAASEWALTKTFTVSVPLNGTYGDTRNVLIMAKASSASQYYNGLAGGATVHVTDMTPEPGYTPPQDPPPDDETPLDDATASEDQGSDGVPVDTGPKFAATSTQDTFATGRIRLDQTQNPAVSKVQRLTDSLVPGRTSATQTALTYLALTLLLGILTMGLVLFRRKKWWGRQMARDDRWYYRHLKLRPKKTKI